MRSIWLFVNDRKMRSSDKYKLFLFMLVVLSGVCGALIWAIFGRLMLPGIVWLICFIGYPAVFVGIFGGSFYLFKHEF